MTTASMQSSCRTWDVQPDAPTPTPTATPTPTCRLRPDQPDDGELVRRAGRGDATAWALLVRRHSGRLWAVARSFRLPDADAADVVQTVWLRLTENLGRLHDPAAVGAWLVTTARRECLRLMRGREHCTADGEIEVQDAGPTPEAAAVTADQAVRLRAALSRLPDSDQRLLRLLTSSPAPSYAEVSAELGMPIGSIGPTRARALARLRRELLAEGVTDSRC